MSILNQIPKPTINLDFVQMQENRNTLSALRSVVEQIPGSAVDFSALRASKKYTQNRLGVITEAGENVPALSFENGVAKGFLAEGEATNQWLYSEPASATGYTATNVEFVSENLGGTVNAVRLADATVSRTLQQAIGNRQGQTLTLSFYVKVGTGVLPNQGAGNYRDFTLTIDNNDVLDYTQFKYEDVGNGVYRVKFTKTFASTNQNAAIRKYSGLNTDTPVVFSRIQLETGSVASSYIPTTTATVTRSADNFRITGASGAIGQTSGVIAVDVDVRNIAESRVIFNAISDPTNNNSIRRIGVFTNGNAYVQIGLTIVQVSDPTTGLARILLRYDSDGFSIVRNGIVGGSSAVTPSADIASVITLGITQAGGANLNDSIQRVRIWNTADWCTDEIAQLLTRP